MTNFGGFCCDQLVLNVSLLVLFLERRHLGKRTVDKRVYVATTNGHY